MVDPLELFYDEDGKYDDLNIHQFIDKFGEEIWRGYIRDDDIIKYLFNLLRSDAGAEYLFVYKNLKILYSFLINIKYNEKYRNKVTRKILIDTYRQLEIYVGDWRNRKYFRDKISIKDQKEIYNEALATCIDLWEYDNIEECDKELPEQFYIINMFPDYEKGKSTRKWLYDFCNTYIKEDY